MTRYFLKRLLLLIPNLFIVITAVFFLLRLVPGDPVDFVLGENAPTEDRQKLVERFELNQPLLTQYKNYLSGLARGDWGRSFFSEKSVTKRIAERYIATLQLAFTALLWALLIAIPLGVWAAVRKDLLADRIILVFSLLGISTPSFYLGPLLALLLAIKLDWLPVSGRELPGSIILPSLTLGLAMSALLTRMVRAAMVEVLQQDYVRTARAKGLTPRVVVFKHALRSALIPVIAVIGLQLGTLLTGAIVTEKIFSWPGLGSLMLESISRRDYAQVQACIILIATTYVLINLITDLTYTLVDPRVEVGT